MTLGIDATVLSYNREGIGNYVQQLILALAESQPVVAGKLKIIAYTLPGLELAAEFERLGIICHEITPTKGLAAGFRLAYRVAQQARIDKIDTLLSTHSHLLPILFKKTVYLVHDISPLTHPDYYKQQSSFLANGLIRQALSRAHLIVTTTEFVKSEIVQFAAITPGKVHVIGAGPGSWVDKSSNPRTNQEVLRKYNLQPEKYFLAIGTVSPRKNYKHLIKEYLVFIDSLPQTAVKPKLVIAGKLGWDYAEFSELIESSPQVNYLDYVSNEDLEILSANCSALISLAKFEGFGMPLLEGALMGRELIASDIPPFIEILPERAAHFVKLDSSASIQEAFNSISAGEKLNKPEIIAELSAKFNWKKVAANLISVIMDKES